MRDTITNWLPFAHVDYDIGCGGTEIPMRYAFSTYGDGMYSVNVTKDENGMITKVEIVVKEEAA